MTRLSFWVAILAIGLVMPLLGQGGGSPPASEPGGTSGVAPPFGGGSGSGPGSAGPIGGGNPSFAPTGRRDGESAPEAGSSGGAPGSTPGRPPGTPPPVTPGRAAPTNAAWAAVPAFKKAESFESALEWGWWWTYNGARYLNLKAVLRRSESGSVNNDLFMDESGTGIDLLESKSDRLRSGILPHLRTALSDSDSDVRARAALAIGRCGDARNLGDLLFVLGDTNLAVREMAVLGLGLLQNRGAVPVLSGIALDTASGRLALERRREIETSTRAAACYALGLLGQTIDLDGTSAVTSLKAALESREASAEIHVAAVTALGLTRAHAALPELTGILADDSRPDILRAHAAGAIGRLGARGATRDLLAALKGRSPHVRRAVTIALGQVAEPADDETLEALMRVARNGVDRAQRNFALIALGQIGGSGPRNFLARVFREGDPYERGFAALALGLYGWHGTEIAEHEVARQLHVAFGETTDHRLQGALAIALGLLHHEAAIPDLIEILGVEAPTQLKAECAQALGLMRAGRAIGELERLLRKFDEHGARASAAIALGLIGDTRAIGVLHDVMAAGTSECVVSGATIQALGLIGDQTVIDGLGAVLADPSRPASLRSTAASALGVLGDKDDLPALTRVAADSNYVSQTGAFSLMLARLF